jgi:hypothetical protein
LKTGGWTGIANAARIVAARAAAAPENSCVTGAAAFFQFSIFNFQFSIFHSPLPAVIVCAL